MTAAHAECSKVLRSLRFDWIQDPVVVLDENLKTVGFTAEYLKTDIELFKVIHDKLYRKMGRKYRPILDFLVPAHFIWKINTMWTLLNIHHDMKIRIIKYKTLSYHINLMMSTIINVFCESVGINKLPPLFEDN